MGARLDLLTNIYPKKLNLIQTLNLHLDRPRLWIRRRLERLDRILQLKPMRHKLTQINDSALDQPNCFRPRVAVSVLELQIHLACTQPHERDLHLVLSHANDKHLASKLDSLDGAVDGRFHTRALHCDGRLDALHFGDNGGAEVVGRVAEFDFVGCDAGNEVFCELEAALINVCNYNGRGSSCARTKQRHQSNGPRAADDDGVSQPHVCAVHARQRNAQRLEHGPVFKGQVVGQLVAPHGRVFEVAAQKSSNRRCGEELDALAAIVAAGQAGLAFVADDVGFDGNAVAGFERRDGRVDGEDGAGGLVTEDVRVFDDHGADAALMQPLALLTSCMGCCG